MNPSYPLFPTDDPQFQAVIPSSLHDPLMNACDGALNRVLKAGAVKREVATELLAADAFVTYAFEAAANEPSTIAARADAAMKRISNSAVSYLNAEQK